VSGAGEGKRLVLVTGAGGSLGRQVCRELLRRGDGLRAADVPGVDLSEFAGSAETFAADVRDADLVGRLTRDVDCVIHLAALLPPASERDRALTTAVNVEGTRNVLAGLAAAGRRGHLVFASSVSTYGDTTTEAPPVHADHPLQPLDIYAESKIAGEALLKAQTEVPWTVLRVAGISVPAFLEPPAVWPFQVDQRVEFVSRDDVALAMANCAGNESVYGRALTIAGGASWRMLGRDYVRAHFDVYGIDPAEASYRSEPGWMDWYDTTESEALLRYQRTSFRDYVDLLTQAIEAALG
jgi:nucleoside-diphosphate-sugar epimerase